MSTIRRFPDARAAAEACGAWILQMLSDAVAQRGSATLAISGGTSPKIMFEYFARASFDWSKVHIFWVDERCVPSDDAQSNFKLAHDSWLKDVPPAQVHRVQTELDPEIAAQQYAEEIRPFLPFDVIHRGMGADAHTASLFPGDPQIQNETGLVGIAKREVTRVTLLPLVLKGAGRTAILATGADKASPLQSVLNEPYEPLKYPAQIASRDPSRAVWFIDEAAAAKL